MSDTGRPGADPTEPGRRPSWSSTGATPPVQPPTQPSGQPRATPPPVTSWQAAPTSQVPPTSPTPQAATPQATTSQASTPPAVPPGSDSEPPADEAKKRPAWLVPTIIGVAVLVVVLIIIGIVTSNGSDDEPPPAVASTVVAESPTPTVAPVARTATTAFATALPASVLQYALATSADNPAWIAAGALEAYTETYTDGASGTATVNAGQWETAPEATAFAASTVAALPAAEPSPSASAEPGAPTFPQTGDVTAGGATVGTYTIVDAGGGNGVAVWTNGTSVFQVTAPLADIVDFYSAYPL